MYKDDKLTDKWWKNAVIYQIYPKSFKDTNGDGIGDIPGIIEKIPYLKSLGVDGLWISPLYLSPQVDNGYDITDYRMIDPMFGTNEEMYALIHEAHAAGIKIIMDFVANHTSDQALWFQESRKSKTNFFSDFYIWKDPKPDGSEPNNWGSNFGGSAWTFDAGRQQYYLHYYAAEQPDLNWENETVRQYIYDMMRFWKSKGVDGWRMDVVTSISKNLDFPDNDRDLVTSNQQNGPRMHEFIHEMNQEVLTPCDMMSVGESPAAKASDAHLLVSPEREELDMIFTFEHMHIDRKQGDINGRWALQNRDLVSLKRILSDWQMALRDNGWNALYFENHDRARVISRWGNDTTYRYECATAFSTVLHGLQGTPYIYQGEEIGMVNADYDLSDYNDIELHGNYDHYVRRKQSISHDEFMRAAYKVSRDHARTPMQWSNDKNAGFSDGKPWLKINPRFSEINAKADMASERSIFKYYQTLIQLRKNNKMFLEGSYELLFPDDEHLFIYKRTLHGETWLIVANLSETMIDSPFENEKAEMMITNMGRRTLSEQLRPYEAFIARV